MRRFRTNRRRAAARVLATGMVAILGQLGLSVPAASAATHPDEATAKASPLHRNTFTFDPGRNAFLSPERLVQPDLRSYYAQYGFDRNFLTWAPEVSYHPGSTEKWSGCDKDTFHPGAPCPLNRVHFNEIREFIGNGPITVRYWNGAFISLLCGNHSERGTPGPAPRISGSKFEDVNGDGTWSSGEPGLGGWTIELLQHGNVVASTQTDAGGSYAFVLDTNTMNITPGTFSLREVDQPGWIASTAPGPVHVPYGAGESTFGGNNFGNFRPASISGGKFEDMDADGSVAGDPGLPGWGISAAGPSPTSVTTDGSGRFTLGGLRPGRYTVGEESRSGWVQSAPSTGTFTVDVRSGDQVQGLEFGNWRPARIEGRKFDDANVDGHGAGEPGLSGWVIEASTGATQTTGQQGGYGFGGLRPGTYRLHEHQQDNWRQSAPPDGTHVVNVRSGDVATGRDFGNVCLGAVRVTVRDTSTSSTLSGLEVRIEEVRVPGILRNDPPLPRTTTADGFDGLLPGTYRVVTFLPDGVFTTSRDAMLVDGRWAVVKTVDVAACTPAGVDVDVVTRSSPGKVTGGMRMNVTGGWSTAGFEFMTQRGEPRGSLEYQDHAGRLNLHTRAIENITIVGQEAWIWGRVPVDGVSQRFRLHLVDAGEPGSADRFELDVAPSYAAGHGQTITGGNVQIHRTP